ncbi:MAG: FecR domain-containing protein [Gammaproteobacteria bacterium]|nr:FecR domain-containing protein [Gammaproteobacteria bacterium]
MVQALSWGLFAAGSTAGLLQPAFAMGDIPAKLPPGRSIYKLKGRVTVDGVTADINTRITANSLIKTGASGQLIFVVGQDAFILRENSELQMGGTDMLIASMRMLTGKLLSVFGKREAPHRIQTVTATIGIRGTGIYVESEPDQSYVCTCYGNTLIASNDNPNISEAVLARHHDQPLYVLAGKGDNIIRPAPFINHTDSELALIEELVGRTTPFAAAADSYEAPRKRSY